MNSKYLHSIEICTIYKAPLFGTLSFWKLFFLIIFARKRNFNEYWWIIILPSKIMCEILRAHLQSFKFSRLFSSIGRAGSCPSPIEFIEPLVRANAQCDFNQKCLIIIVTEGWRGIWSVQVRLYLSSMSVRQTWTTFLVVIFLYFNLNQKAMDLDNVGHV